MKKINILIFLLVFLCANGVIAQETLTLDESIKLALQNNYEVKNSELGIRAARQTKKSALTSYFPSISAGGLKLHAEEPLMEIGFHGLSMGFLEKGTIGYVGAVQPIFAGGRIINGNKLASLGEDVSEFKKKITKDEVILKTEEQYWQVISLEEKYKTIDKYEEMLDDLSKQVTDAYNSGIVMKNDVLKVKLKKSEVLLNKSKLSNGIELAQMAFCQYLGLPLDSQPILKDSLAIGESPQSLFVENSQVLKNRNEYKLLELSVRAEKLQTRITRGQYLPQVAIGADYQYLKFDESKGRTFGMIYGTLSMPISGWWGGSHELNKRKQEEQIAENSFNDNSEKLLLQMEKTWQDLGDAYTQYQLSEETKEQATENMKVNQDSYDNGLTAVSDLLEARALLQQAEDQLIEAKTNYLILKTKYLQVTGRKIQAN
jgi:outer membrane protein